MATVQKGGNNRAMINNLKQLRIKHGLTQEALADLAKCHPVTISNLESGAELPVRWVRRFAAALNEPEAAFTGTPQAAAVSVAADIPVYGAAAGSLTGAFTITSDAVDWVKRPFGLAGARDAYALFVRGSSMEPRFFPGDIIYVAPHRPVRHNDVVVIQQADGATGGVQAWLKVFDHTDERMLHARQYNPPAVVKFPHGTIRALHRVLTVNELLGS